MILGSDFRIGDWVYCMEVGIRRLEMRNFAILGSDFRIGDWVYCMEVVITGLEMRNFRISCMNSLSG